jgi:hypothetical protein
MKILNCVLTALAVGVLSSLIISIYIAGQSDIPATGWVAFFMLFGNTILPVLLAVCLFAVLKKNITSVNLLAKFFLQAGLVLIIMAIGVFLMTVSRSVSYYGSLSGLAPQNLRDQFDARYKGYIPHVLLDVFLIPVIYYWVTQITKSLQK